MNDTGFMNNTELRNKRMRNNEGTMLSVNGYNAVIGLLLVFGLGINALMSIFLTPLVAEMNPWLLIVVYLDGSIGSTFVIQRSTTAAVSLLGFTGLAVSTGLLLTSFLTMFPASTIYTAFLATGIIVVAMLLLSTIFPGFFLSIGRTLVFALIGSILIEFVGGLFLGLALGWMDYVVVIIFAGFIGFDWARAQAYPKTFKNAVESSADIYMDVIVIFMRVLNILGKKD